MSVRAAQLLLVVCWLIGLPFAAPALAEKRIGLVIANQNYTAPELKLENTHRDGELIKKALEQVGFDVTLVNDTESQAQLQQAISEYVGRLTSAGPDAIGFLYYSGHGVADGPNGKNYLIPTAAPLTDSAQLPLLAVPLDTILESLSAAGGQMSFVVFDACRNAPIRRPDKALFKGFAPVREQQGLLVAFATQAGDTAIDQNIYARALAEELVKPGLEAGQVFRAVTRRVLQSTQKQQQPEYLDKRLYDFRFVDAAQPEPHKFSLASAAAPQTPEIPSAEDLIVWRGIEGTTSCAVLRNFAKKYPTSVFGESGQARAKELRCDQKMAALVAPKAAVASPCGAGTLVKVAEKEVCLRPGEPFSDCSESCPQMVMLPAGEFLIGAAPEEIATLKKQFPSKSFERESAQTEVKIGQPFAVGRSHVTRGEFAAFVKSAGYKISGGCYSLTGAQPKFNASQSWQEPGFPQDDTHPVVCVNWDDASAYARWLSSRTGYSYRLLTEAEAEYAARGAVTQDPQPSYLFGDDQKDLCAFGNGADLAAKVNFASWAGGVCSDGFVFTAPVASFKPNAFGLYDVIGNVWTWTADCWNDSNVGNPGNGRARTTGTCIRRVVRGGSWNFDSLSLRTSVRQGFSLGDRDNFVGFRLARAINR